MEMASEVATNRKSSSLPQLERDIIWKKLTSDGLDPMGLEA